VLFGVRESVLQAQDKPGGEFHLRRAVPLSHVPFRISMTSDKLGILMALGFLGEGGDLTRGGSRDHGNM
jgi:hypothetical protein